MQHQSFHLQKRKFLSKQKHRWSRYLTALPYLEKYIPSKTLLDWEESFRRLIDSKKEELRNQNMQKRFNCSLILKTLRKLVEVFLIIFMNLKRTKYCQQINEVSKWKNFSLSKISSESQFLRQHWKTWRS